MGLYRSERMKLYQLTLPKDDAQATMLELGDLGSAHFIDLNANASAYGLPYTSRIKLIEESERKLHYLFTQSKNYYLHLTAPQDVDAFLEQVRGISQNKRKAMNLLLEEIVKDIHTQESFIKQQNEQVKIAEYELIFLLDTLQVYKVDQRMMPRLESRFKESAGDIESESVNLIASASAESNLHKIAGVVDKVHIERLRRLIFRTTKGKSFLFVQDYENDHQIGNTSQRSIYIIMYWAGAAIREKICRICDSFEGQRFDLPHPEMVDREIKRISQGVQDARNVLIQTRSSMADQLNHFNNNANNNGGQSARDNISTIYVYQMFLAREKALYTTMNMMILQNQTFVAYFWAPIADQTKILKKIEHLRAVRVAAYDNHQIPRPTFVKTNEFTAIYQLIVDTYGVPSYQEANPAVLSIATFPFFFGMMFGDMGHGSVLFFIASILVLFAKKIKSPQTKGLMSARYLLLLMGMMSTFAGLIYNEYFAIPTNIFGSCYDLNNPIPLSHMTANATIANNATIVNNATIANNATIVNHAHHATKSSSSHNMVYWRRHNNKCVYPFGQDPVWSAAVNKLTFVNSIKMKMSVIFGVMHMSFGILCKGTNMIYQRKYMELLTEVIGGFIILWGLFGWMDALIIVKFFKTYDIDDCSKLVNGRCIGELQNEKTPGIINIIITTVFAFGNYDTRKPKEPLIGSTQDEMYMYALFLLLSVVVSVPIMLFTKPCMFLSGQKKMQVIDAQGHIELMKIDNNHSPERNNKVGDQYQELEDDNELQLHPMSQQDQMVKHSQDQYQHIMDTLQSMEPEDHQDSFGGIFIHQMIETIEFVLGTVSNTASYLRLWALSLAHTQLADTFLKLPFGPMVFGTENFALLIVKSLIFWPILWTISFGVLMCMDLLECFLHTLRLHWVEFQNKFYKGQGYAYKPFNFSSVLQNTIDSANK